MTAATLDFEVRAAIHEAGHAVIALRCGVAVRYITLAPHSAASAAQTRYRPGRAQLRHQMAWTAAATIVEDIYTGCCDRAAVVGSGAHDYIALRDQARAVRAYLRGGVPTGLDLPMRATVRKVAEVAWARTYRMVIRDYGAILAVADAVLASERALTGPQIRRLADSAGRARPPRTAHLAEQFWPPWFMSSGWWTRPPEVAASPARVTFRS